MDVRTLIRAFAAARVCLGLALFAAPRTAARLWLGDDQRRSGTVLARGLGARDLAIGVGMWVALDDDRDPSPWLDAGVIADTADATAALAARHSMPTANALGTAVVASAGAIGGLLLKRALTAGR